MVIAASMSTVDTEQEGTEEPFAAQSRLGRLCSMRFGDACRVGHVCGCVSDVMILEIGRCLRRHWLKSARVPRNTNGEWQRYRI